MKLKKGNKVRFMWYTHPIFCSVKWRDWFRVGNIYTIRNIIGNVLYFKETHYTCKIKQVMKV